MPFCAKMNGLARIVSLLGLVSGSWCWEKLFSDLEPMNHLNEVMELNETYRDLARSIEYTYPRQMWNCISIVGDKSYFSEIFFMIVQSGVPPPIVIFDKANRFKCDCIFLIVDDVEGLKSVMEGLPRFPTHRLWCLVNRGTLDDLEISLGNDHGIFGDAEVIVFSFEQYDYALRIQQPDRVFSKISIPENGSWPIITNHIRAFSGKQIRYSTADCDIHVIQSDRGRWGMDWVLFKAIADGMNLTVKYVELPNPNSLNIFGKFENGKWTGGILENIDTGRADVGFCGLLFEKSKYLGRIEMGIPFRSVCVTYAVRRPQPDLEDWTVVFNSFKPSIHVSLVLSVALFATVLQVVASSPIAWRPKPTPENRFSSWTYCCTVSWGLLLQGYLPNSPRLLGSLRGYIFLWALFSLLMACSFSSHLTTNFTRPRLTPKPRDINDLVNSNYESPLQMLFPLKTVLNYEDPYTKKWLEERTYFVSSFDELVHTLDTQDKIAILGQTYDSFAFIPATTAAIPEGVMNRYETMDMCVTLYEGFAFRRGSPFKTPFNEYMLHLQQYGFLKKYNAQTLFNVTSNHPSLKSVLQPESSRSGIRPLNLFHMKGIFVVWFIGEFIACLVFVAELAFFKCCK